MMEIIDVHDEEWVVHRRWQPWKLKLFGWRRLRELHGGAADLADLVVIAALAALFALPGLVEVVAAAMALPAVLVLRLVGAMTTTIEVREYGPRSRPHRERRYAWTVWTVPVRGWRRARQVRTGWRSSCASMATTVSCTVAWATTRKETASAGLLKLPEALLRLVINLLGDATQQ